MKFSRKTGAALFVTLFLALGIAATKPTDKPDAERIYKNLKVLPKDISKADLDKVMDNFKTALGYTLGHQVIADCIGSFL